MPLPPNVLTQRSDPSRTGVMNQETALQPRTAVNGAGFGKVATFFVDGDVYAQPLYVPKVDFGAQGVHDALIVATMNNTVFAFDAKAVGTPTPIWVSNPDAAGKPTPLTPPVPAGLFGAGYYDIVSPVAASGLAQSTIGILGTPVIDAQIDPTGAAPSTGIIYFVAQTWDKNAFDAAVAANDPVAAGEAFSHCLYALNLRDGSLVGPPATINGEFPGVGYARTKLDATKDLSAARLVSPEQAPQNVFEVTVRGVRVHVIEATNLDFSGPTPTGTVLFTSIMQLQRPGLLLQDGRILIAFGARGDMDPWHGWIFAYDKTTLAQTGILCTTPNGARGGVWQAGQGLLDDGAGNFYAGTGNGDSDPTVPAANLESPNLGEGFVKLTATPTGIRIIGWFNAFDDIKHRDDLNQITGPNGEVVDRGEAHDDDVGASAPVLAPDGRIPAGGKDGWLYLINPARLDNAGNPNAIDEVFIASYNLQRGTRTNSNSYPDRTHHIHGAPVILDQGDKGCFLFVWGENDVLRVHQYTPASAGTPTSGGFSGVPPFQPKQIVDAHDEAARGTKYASVEDGAQKGMPGGFLSLSRDASDPASAILWASLPPLQNGNRQPVAGELVAYDAASFNTNLTFARLNLIWSSRHNPEDDSGLLAKFCCPTVADGRVYMASFGALADRPNPARPRFVSAYGLKAVKDGGYNLGFGGKDGLTLNGSARVESGAIILTELPLPTDGNASQSFAAGSVFANALHPIAGLDTTFQIRFEQAQADGFTFAIQAEPDGRYALGSEGSGLGFGLNTATNPPVVLSAQPQILHGFAITFRYFNAANPTNPQGIIGTRFSASQNVTEQNMPASLGFPGNPGPTDFTIRIRYNSPTVTVDVQNNITAATATFTFNNVGDIAAQIISTTGLAYLGFTGGTGGFAAKQTILSWTVV